MTAINKPSPMWFPFRESPNGSSQKFPPSRAKNIGLAPKSWPGGQGSPKRLAVLAQREAARAAQRGQRPALVRRSQPRRGGRRRGRRRQLRGRVFGDGLWQARQVTPRRTKTANQTTRCLQIHPESGLYLSKRFPFQCGMIWFVRIPIGMVFLLTPDSEVHGGSKRMRLPHAAVWLARLRAGVVEHQGVGQLETRKLFRHLRLALFSQKMTLRSPNELTSPDVPLSSKGNQKVMLFQTGEIGLLSSICIGAVPKTSQEHIKNKNASRKYKSYGQLRLSQDPPTTNLVAPKHTTPCHPAVHLAWNAAVNRLGPQEAVRTPGPLTPEVPSDADESQTGHEGPWTPRLFGGFPYGSVRSAGSEKRNDKKSHPFNMVSFKGNPKQFIPHGVL